MAGVSNTLPGAPIDPSLPGADIAAGTPDPLGRIRGWAQSVGNLVSGMSAGQVAGALPGGGVVAPLVAAGESALRGNATADAKMPPPAAAPPQAPPVAEPAAAVAPIAQAAPAAPTGYVTGLENPSIQRVANRGGTPARDVQVRSTVANQAYEQAETKAADANQDVAARNVNIANERKQLFEDEATKAGERYDAARDANAKRKAEYETRLREFDEYNKAMPDDPIDPDRFWNSRSSSQKAAGFIAAALGGWLQGSGATAQNSAVAQLNTAIEQDVASQRASYEAKKGKLGNLQTAYGLAMQKYNDADAAEAAAKAYLLDQTKLRMEAEAAKKGTVDAVNAAQTAGAQLAEERAKRIDQGAKRVQATAGTPMYMVAGNPIPQTAEQARAYYEKLRLTEHQGAIDITKESAKPDNATKVTERVVNLPNGGQILAKSGDEGRKIQASVDAGQLVRRDVGEALDIRKKMGLTGRMFEKYTPGTSESGAQLQAIKSRLTTGLNTVAAAGALDAGMQSIIGGQIDAINDIGDKGDAQLRAIEKNINDAIDFKVQGQTGYRPKSKEEYAAEVQRALDAKRARE